MAPPPPWPMADKENASASLQNTARSSIRPTRLEFATPSRELSASPAKTPRPSKRGPMSITAQHFSARAVRDTPRAPPSTPAPSTALARVAPRMAGVIAATPRARVQATPAYGKTGTRVESKEMWNDLNRRNLAAWTNFVLSARVGGLKGLEGEAAKKMLAGMRAVTERPDIKGALESVRKDIRERRFYIQRSIDMRFNPAQRNGLLKLLLLTYEPAWLLPCLALVLQDTRCMDLSSLPVERTDRDIMARVETLLLNKLLGDQLNVHDYLKSMPDLISNPADIPKEIFNAAVLDAALSVIIVLDCAKWSAADAPTVLLDVDNDPPLFRHDSPHKKSEDVLAALGQALLSDHGNIKRFLGYKGYKLSYCAPPYESEIGGGLFVQSVDDDFKDGIRLCKLASLLAKDSAMLHSVVTVSDSAQSKPSTINATERLSWRNLRLALRTFNATSEGSVNYKQQDKYDWTSTTRSLAKGNLSTTIEVLWRVVWLWVSERVIGKFTFVETETSRLHREFRAERDKGIEKLPVHRRLAHERVLENSPSDAKDMEGYCVGTGSHEALAWVTAVGMFYGKTVREWTESFRDGSMLCLLIHHYYPDLMPLHAITNVPLAELRPNERSQHNEAEVAARNFEQFTKCAASLGGIPHLPIDVLAAHAPGFTSNDKPLTFGRQMRLLASYLFARCVTFQPVSDEDEESFNVLQKLSLATPMRTSMKIAETESQRRLSALARQIQSEAMSEVAAERQREIALTAVGISLSSASDTAAAQHASPLSSPGSSIQPQQVLSSSELVPPHGEMRDNVVWTKAGAAKLVYSSVLSWWTSHTDRQRYLQLRVAANTVRFYWRASRANRLLQYWNASAHVIQRAWWHCRVRRDVVRQERLLPVVQKYVRQRDLSVLSALARSRQGRVLVAKPFLDSTAPEGHHIEQDGAAIVLQKQFRGFSARQATKFDEIAAQVLILAWRSRAAREVANDVRQRRELETIERERDLGLIREAAATQRRRDEKQKMFDARAAASLTARNAWKMAWQAACAKQATNEKVHDEFVAACIRSDAKDRDQQRLTLDARSRALAFQRDVVQASAMQDSLIEQHFGAFAETISRCTAEQGRVDSALADLRSVQDSVQATVDEISLWHRHQAAEHADAEARYEAAMQLLSESRSRMLRLSAENEELSSVATDRLAARLQEQEMQERRSLELIYNADSSLSRRTRLQDLKTQFDVVSDAASLARTEYESALASDPEIPTDSSSNEDLENVDAWEGPLSELDITIAHSQSIDVASAKDLHQLQDLFRDFDALSSAVQSQREEEIARRGAADHFGIDAAEHFAVELQVLEVARRSYGVRQAQLACRENELNNLIDEQMRVAEAESRGMLSRELVEKAELSLYRRKRLQELLSLFVNASDNESAALAEFESAMAMDPHDSGSHLVFSENLEEESIWNEIFCEADTSIELSGITADACAGDLQQLRVVFDEIDALLFAVQSQRYEETAMKAAADHLEDAMAVSYDAKCRALETARIAFAERGVQLHLWENDLDVQIAVQARAAHEIVVAREVVEATEAERSRIATGEAAAAEKTYKAEREATEVERLCNAAEKSVTVEKVRKPDEETTEAKRSGITAEMAATAEEARTVQEQETEAGSSRIAAGKAAAARNARKEPGRSRMATEKAASAENSRTDVEEAAQVEWHRAEQAVAERKRDEAERSCIAAEQVVAEQEHLIDKEPLTVGRPTMQAQRASTDEPASVVEQMALVLVQSGYAQYSNAVAADGTDSPSNSGSSGLFMAAGSSLLDRTSLSIQGLFTDNSLSGFDEAIVDDLPFSTLMPGDREESKGLRSADLVSQKWRAGKCAEAAFREAMTSVALPATTDQSFKKNETTCASDLVPLETQGQDSIEISHGLFTSLQSHAIRGPVAALDEKTAPLSNARGFEEAPRARYVDSSPAMLFDVDSPSVKFGLPSSSRVFTGLTPVAADSRIRPSFESSPQEGHRNTARGQVEGTSNSVLSSPTTAFAAVVGQRQNACRRDDVQFTPLPHRLQRSTPKFGLNSSVGVESSVLHDVATLQALPKVSDAILSPDVQRTIRSLSISSRSPNNRRYMSSPDFLRIVLTMLRVCSSESRRQAAVAKSGIVELGLRVLQNVCLDDEGAQVLFDIEDSIEVLATFLQFGRYESLIFSRAVDILHCFCKNEARVNVLRNARGISTRLRAVLKVQEHNLAAFTRDMQRLQKTEALLLELDQAGDMAPQIPKQTLPDITALTLLGDVCRTLK
jgi:hypothetical protein